MPDRSYPNIFSKGRPLRYSFGGKLLEANSKVKCETRMDRRRGKESRTVKKGHPMGRLGEPEEVANAILFLAPILFT